ncbi:N-acetyltransferase [Flaviaesturariibacter flavus]|uniref:N-acetyltransferase n=1 Tax=Flaviaesturariibacter flavus TaxID=2502780 RepID=A0A4V2NV83_9BACT|nr:GNAT family protein [Flaviaesturariibacter flavus]TCJ12486.1 N-acetyltransferase [Flaviaesturariibacter flavus]
MTFYNTVQPVFETERFRLRGMEPADQANIFRGLSHPQVIPYYGVRYDTLEDTATQMEWYAQLWRESTGGWWKITDRETGRFAGAIGFNALKPTQRSAEIGYWLLPEWWHHGVVREVGPQVFRYLFAERGLHRLEAVVETENTASSATAKALGFTYEGTLRECERKDGRWISLEYWSLLAHEFATFEA